MAKTVYDIVTEKVLEAFNADTVPWQKPWKAGGIKPCNAVTGREYNGGNYFLLSMMPFAVPAYMTMKQMNAVGATIKAGQEKKYFPVFFWSVTEKLDANGKKAKSMFLRYFLVWNIEQVDGYELPEKFKTIPDNNHNTIVSCEQIIANFEQKPEIVNGGNRAYYSPTLDKVVTPELNTFDSPESYYAVLFHELAHSTGHVSRLNRKEVMDTITFGSHDYSLEEMVAELTSAFICAEVGLDNTSDNSTAYIKSWYAKLKNDPKLFWTASSRAQKASDYILNKVKAEWVEPEKQVA